LALAIVSRSVADEDGDFDEPFSRDGVDVGSAEPDRVCDDIFEGGEKASEDSIDKVEEAVLGILPHCFSTSPETFAGGFANAS